MSTAKVTRAAEGVPGINGDITSTQLADNYNNLFSFLEGNNIKDGNVNHADTDGVMVKAIAQIVTGLKTFDNASAAAGGVRTALQVSHNPGSGTATDGDGVEVLFIGDDDGGNATTYGELEVVFADTGDGSEDSTINIKNLVGGASTTALALSSSGAAFSGALLPSADDGAALGASGTAWSDLFLASGGVVNWNAGDVTLTHSANALTVDGGDTFIANGNGLVVGHSSQIDTGQVNELQVLGAAGADSRITLGAWAAEASGPELQMVHSRNTTIGSSTIVQDNDVLGQVRFLGDDGTDFKTAGALISAEVDGTPGANDMPTRLEFHTNAGAASATERMRIDSSGVIFTGAETSNANMSGGGITLDQNAADDEILAFKSSDVAHGITDKMETDTYATFQKYNGAGGGLQISGAMDTNGDAHGSLRLWGMATEAAITTKSTAGFGVVHVGASLKSGTGLTDIGANGNLLSIGTGSTSNTVRFIFDADGDGHADSSWTTYSDSRLKSDLEPIPYGLKEVLAIDPLRFTKESGKIESGKVVLEGNKSKRIGFIAQDVKALMPELVKDVDEETSFYSLDYGHFTPVLWNAVRELEARLALLEA